MSKRFNAIEEDGDESLYNKKFKKNDSDSDDNDDNDDRTNDLGSSGFDGEKSKQIQCIENNLSTSVVRKNDGDGPCLLSIVSQIVNEGCDSKADAYKESVIDEEEKQQEPYDSDRPSLLNLSDDVLLIILKSLHPFDLLNVSRTCLRLNSVCRDRTLWIDVDFRHDITDKNFMKTTVDYDNFLEFLLPNTRSIKKNGSTRLEFTEFACTSNKTTQVSITSSFILAVKSKVPCLKSFTLEDHVIYGPTITLDCFPTSLETLSLKNSLVIRLPTDRSYFVKIDKMLPNLRILDLSGCQWFHAHSFLALSKSKTLKELHLKGCLGIEDCVPYASLAATFGFPSLELLDLRLTHVSDSDISCFNRVENLKTLYLEALDWPGGENKISDIGVASFGSERDLLNANPVGLSFILIRNQRPGQSALERLMLRNYRSVTDISLKHAASCLPNLKYLDVRGTSCTENGVSDFKRCRPDVELLTDFNNNLLLESTS